MAATESSLGALHELTAETLANIIREGVPLVNKETGEVEGYGPAPAPYIAAAIKFLKDNNIEALPTPDNHLGRLAKALPSFDTGDDLYAKH